MDEPAFPRAYVETSISTPSCPAQDGMTKLEYAAIQVMQGYVIHFGVVAGVSPNNQDLARYAVDQAEALLEELEARKRGE